METRSQDYQCPIFGLVEDIKKNNNLPTYEDVMKCYKWNRIQLKIRRNTTKEPSFLDSAELVSQRVEEVWRQASLPIVSHLRVIQLIKAYHSKCHFLMKSLKRLSYERKNLFLQKSKFLFDICSCKCKEIEICSCPIERKVPKERQNFLLEQRQVKNILFVGVDSFITDKSLKRPRASIDSNISIDQDMEKQDSVSYSSDSEGNSSSFSKFSLPSTLQINKKIAKSIKIFPTVARTCKRYNISDEIAAEVVSSVLHDISSDFPQNV